jgi:hypothetical protein
MGVPIFSEAHPVVQSSLLNGMVEVEKSSRQAQTAITEESNLDRYTKAMLTIIATALWALFLQNTGSISLAQQHETVQHVAICDVTGLNCVKVFGTGSYSPISKQPLPDNQGSLAIHDQH